MLSVSILLITGGDLKSLAAVYTLAFLSVMALFAAGNLLLKIKRRNLPRPVQAPWLVVIIAMIAVTVALWGNARLNQDYLIVFLEYLVPTILIVTIMLTRVQVLRFLVFMIDEFRDFSQRKGREAIEVRDTRSALRWFSAFHWANRINRKLHDAVESINNQQFVFFTRGDNLKNLNRAILYIGQNEHTSRVKIVNIYRDPSEIAEGLQRDVEFLDRAYPNIDVELVTMQGVFSPELIETLSEQWSIPRNLMFIGTPSGKLPFDLQSLGGVRLII